MLRTFKNIIFFIAAYFLNYRKETLSFFLLMAMLYSIWFVSDDVVTNTIVALVTILISTDYRVLKWIYPPLYDTIQTTPNTIIPEQPIQHAKQVVESSFKAKRYAESGNPELPIIHSSNNEIIVDSRITSTNLAEGMLFEICFTQEFEFQNNIMPVTRRVGLAQVIRVTDQSTFLKPIEWYNDHPIEELKIRRGNLNELDPFVRVKMSTEVKNTNLDDLKEAYLHIEKAERGQKGL